ncbi:hypothetical protein ACIQLK_14060 [Microbacterium sp. NPDC091382]|uniref:hypothetical protein n=1 Tax=Microbacterium sp. NPDC091382 TaxID=3364210 RepID=UPI003828FAE6
MGEIFSENLISWFWAPLSVGVGLWLAAEAFRAVRGSIASRRRRRMQIVTLMGRAENLVVRAVRDGLYEEAWISNTSEPLARVREQYDDLTVEALALFEEREGAVSYWAAVEFYAGFEEPLRYLEITNTPRRRERNAPLLHPSQAGVLWYPPRPALLVYWAKRRWLWVRGNEGGPWFGDMHSEGGDKSRHQAVTPNSCGPGDILLPGAWRSRRRLSSEDYAPFERVSGL